MFRSGGDGDDRPPWPERSCPHGERFRYLSLGAAGLLNGDRALRLVLHHNIIFG